jgi:DNA-binding transcriptional MerR regulator
MQTIGELAKILNIRTSAIRFYEKEGLIPSGERNQSGYRVYDVEIRNRILLIQRAQNLGFSLADIKILLEGMDNRHLSNTDIIELSEKRFFALEKKATEIMVLQHEMGLFLQDLRISTKKKKTKEQNSFDELVKRICSNPTTSNSSLEMMDWLMSAANCNLTTKAAQKILKNLKGHHTHIWQENNQYHILLVTKDEGVKKSLDDLAKLENNCKTHETLSANTFDEEEGVLFVAGGENAFIFARLFIALENA